MKKYFDSRKVMLGVIGSILVAVGPKIGLNTEQIYGIIGLLGAAILGLGMADFGKEAKTDESKTPAPPVAPPV